MARLLIVLALLVGCDAGQLQMDTGIPLGCRQPRNALPNGTVCLVCDGQPHTRVYGGADGWCDFDGASCACHGHGVGDQCQQAIADFDEACYGRPTGGR
jgi:hypothetical protein